MELDPGRGRVEVRGVKGKGEVRPSRGRRAWTEDGEGLEFQRNLSNIQVIRMRWHNYGPLDWCKRHLRGGVSFPGMAPV